MASTVVLLVKFSESYTKLADGTLKPIMHLLTTKFFITFFVKYDPLCVFGGFRVYYYMMWAFQNEFKIDF